MQEESKQDTKVVFSDGLFINQKNKNKPNKKDELLRAGNTVTIKLISGEELIARVEEVEENGVLVRKPLVMNLIQVPGSSTQAGVVFVPFLISSEEGEPVFLETKNIVAVAKPNREALRGYTKNTTGLDIPGMGLGNIDLAKFKREKLNDQ